VGNDSEFARKEARLALLARNKPDDSARLLELGQEDIYKRYHFYEQLAGVSRETAAQASAEATSGGNGENKTKDSKEVGA